MGHNRWPTVRLSPPAYRRHPTTTCLALCPCNALAVATKKWPNVIGRKCEWTTEIGELRSHLHGIIEMSFTNQVDVTPPDDTRNNKANS